MRNSYMLAVVGPTASGKSDLAVRLAERFHSEVINCDMLQVFQGFAIGSAKLTLEEQRGIPHHMFDRCRPDERYDAARFRSDACLVLEEMSNRDPSMLPVIAGGSTFYLESLLFGLDDLPASDPEVRSSLKLLTSEELYKKLEILDARRASELHPHDRFRVERAVENALLTGQSSEQFFQRKKRYDPQLAPCLFLVLCWDREKLYARIESRVRDMIAKGLIKEVNDLKNEYGEMLQGFDAIGYRQVLDMQKGILPVENLPDEISKKTRNFAKRQMTYWRNAPRKFAWDFQPDGSVLNDLVELDADKGGRVSASMRKKSFHCFSWTFDQLEEELQKALQKTWAGGLVWYLDAERLFPSPRRHSGSISSERGL